MVDENDYSKKPNFRLDENNLPVNWSLQIGSFQKEQNAVGLRARLREQNFRSYILSGKSSTGDWYRVFVGPLSDRSALNGNERRDRKNVWVEGNIVRHRVEQDADLFGADFDNNRFCDSWSLVISFLLEFGED